MTDESVTRRDVEEITHRLEQKVDDQLRLLETRIDGVIETARAQREQAERVALTLASQVETTRSQLATQLTDTAAAMATATDKVAVSLEKRIGEASAQSMTQLEGMRREVALTKDASQIALDKALEGQSEVNTRVSMALAHIAERMDMHPTARDVAQALESWQSSHSEMHRGLERTLVTIEPHSAHEIWREAHAVEHRHLQEGIHIAEQDGKDDLAATMNAHQASHTLTTEAQRDAEERKRDADRLSSEKLDMRLGEMNNLRTSLDRAQALFTTRDQLEDLKKQVIDRIDILERLMAGDQGRQQGTIRLMGGIIAVLGSAVPIVLWVMTHK